METKPCLNDKDEYPDDEVLSRCLGKVKPAWDSFVALLDENYPSFSAEWRYYKDGNNWLCKVAKKKKTVCWVSVWINAFKATFYFPDRAEDPIVTSKLKEGVHRAVPPRQALRQDPRRGRSPSRGQPISPRSRS